MNTEREIDSKYLVCVESVENILVSFGITKATKNYDRWVSEQGCLLSDFSDVLYESKFVFIFDWRGEIKEDIKPVIKALNNLKVDIKVYEVEDNENMLKLECGNDSCTIEYTPNNENTSWNKVINNISKIVPPHIIFKQDYWNGGSDTEVYAVLHENEWKYIYELEPKVMNYLFKEL